MKTKAAKPKTPKKTAKSEVITIGELIFKEREKRQWTQQKLAKAAGLRQQLIDSIEQTGGLNARFVNVVKVCRALGFDLTTIANTVLPD